MFGPWEKNCHFQHVMATVEATNLKQLKGKQVRFPPFLGEARLVLSVIHKVGGTVQTPHNALRIMQKVIRKSSCSTKLLACLMRPYFYNVRVRIGEGGTKSIKWH